MKQLPTPPAGSFRLGYSWIPETTKMCFVYRSYVQTRTVSVGPDALDPKLEDLVKQALLKTVGDNKNQALVLRADGKSPHQSVVRAMDAASQIGLTRLSIATVENR